MSKTIVHEVVSDYQRVTAEMGRQPTRDEYLIHGVFSKHTIISTFGSWTAFLQASGLQYNQGKRDKQEIRKQIAAHIELESKERQPVVQPPKLYNQILVLSDRHKPYDHQDSNAFVLALYRKYRPDLVVDIGDAEDFHALSFHDSNSDLLSAGHELRAVIESNREIYQEIPEMMICESNHGSMVFRKGLHHGIPRHVLKSYKEILECPAGWTWHHEIIVQMSNGRKCLFAHGYSSNVLSASQRRGMSIVQGHHHSKMGIQYWSNADGLHFAAQTGCLINDASYAFAYNKLQLDRPILGCLRIEAGVPHILPMFLDKNNRWNGVVP